MSDEVKRTVTVADDDGKAKRFEPGALPESTSKVVRGRLERAGAFGDRPTTASGGARTLENGGFNPVTSTATADTRATESSRDYDAKSVETNTAGEGVDSIVDPNANAHGIGPDTDGGPNPDFVDLDGMTKAELVKHAEANGIEINASANKAEILAAIKAA